MSNWKTAALRPDICIYHGGCDDGFGAAWVVWKKWGAGVTFIPGVYANEPPDVVARQILGKHILLVDFSYKRPIIEAMARSSASLTILDHHKTAQADLHDLEAWAEGEGLEDRVCVIFDMERSGARLAWDFCFAGEEAPTLIDYVEDRDLWRFAYGDNTRLYSAALRTYPQSFQVWDVIARNSITLLDEGRIVLRAHRTNLEKFLLDKLTATIGGHQVPCLNVPYHYASDAAHELLVLFPKAPFAAAWFRRGDGLYQYSLRSEDSRLDVSEIAKAYGGGGHRNAAGFQVGLEVRELV